VPLIIGGGACSGAFASQRENIGYAKDPGAPVGTLDSIVRKEENETFYIIGLSEGFSRNGGKGTPFPNLFFF
jgi:hypothetical protein